MLKLDPEKPLSHSAPKLARSYLQAAIDHLEEKRLGLHDSVHEARKNLKRVRALLRLAEEGPKPLKNIRKQIAEAARSLSELRDSAALVECADKLKTYLEARQDSDIAIHLKEAVERRRDLMAFEEPTVTRLLEPVIDACHKAKNDIEKCDWDKAGENPVDSADTIAAGRRKNHERAVKTLKTCHHGGEPESFHDLRKCAQATFYQAALLKPAWPFAFDSEAKAAKQIADILGHEHDIEVLNILVQVEPHLFGAIANRDRLSELLNERRASLRHDAMAIANALYGDDPAHDEKRLKTLWKLASQFA